MVYLLRFLKLDGVILSADDFFVTDGQYKFDFGKLGEAHEWNQKRGIFRYPSIPLLFWNGYFFSINNVGSFLALQSATEGENPIIIDNTNSQMWEMKVYAKLVSIKKEMGGWEFICCPCLVLVFTLTI